MIESAVCFSLLFFVSAVLGAFYLAKRVYRNRPVGSGDSLLANLFSEVPAVAPVKVEAGRDE